MSTETKTTVQSQVKERFGVRALVNIGMLAAIAVILMLFEIPLPFAPSFYEIDFSEVPVMVGCFAMGPFAGALIEFVKILLNFVFTGTDTAGVGELANFIIGCSLCVPAGLIYRRKRYKNNSAYRYGCRHGYNDGDRMRSECICPSADLCYSVRNADRCSCGNGNSSEPAINSLTTLYSLRLHHLIS